MRRQLSHLLTLAAVRSLTVTSAVHASADDPVSAGETVQYGWKNLKGPGVTLETRSAPGCGERTLI